MPLLIPIASQKPSTKPCLGGSRKQLLNLAAPAHGGCTSLVCSCYVAPRNSDTIEEESRKARDKAKLHNRNRRFDSRGLKDQCGDIIGFGVEGGDSKEHSDDQDGPLKSNLKKGTGMSSMVEMNHHHIDQGLRKVSWSDAHGRDIAHVQEFEPSEEGELGEGVRNSCKCIIQ